MSDCTAYQVGRYYTVPTVHGDIRGYKRHWPVIGPMHDDREFINFPNKHFHVDWRFIGENDYRLITGLRTSPLAIVFQTDPYWMVNIVVPDITQRRKLCKRKFPDYPFPPPWIQKLEQAYAHCKLKGMVCPHRGLPLKTIQADGYDIITCPGHGLQWNAKTGEMYRWSKPDLESKRGG